jgi:broad specificity phosphatase PhoE
MKWPNTLTVVRHGESEYNVLKAKKEVDPTFIELKEAYEHRDVDPLRAMELADQLIAEGKFNLPHGDHATPLTPEGRRQAKITGRKLAKLIPMPDVVFVSPYLRTHQTLAQMAIGWQGLEDIPVVVDERLREQEHGLSTIYPDWRVYNLKNPNQATLRDREGQYWYRYLNGESVPDARERIRSWLGALTRDYAGKNVLTISHHLTKLAIRANLERFGPEEYIRLDLQEKPVNCGVTIYRGFPGLGVDGKLKLDKYNQQLY